MGYRDDFYTVGNIIGYSGQLNDFPTVYFLSDAEWGHITQKHPLPQNVGRQSVGDATHYEIGNERVHGTLKLVEKLNGRVFHESRSTLKRIDPNSFETVDFKVLGILAQAIRNCPNEKNISEFSGQDMQKIEQAENSMSAVLDQLKAR
jgi:hypothetical protein